MCLIMLSLILGWWRVLIRRCRFDVCFVGIEGSVICSIVVSIIMSMFVIVNIMC